jgi:hypothetical protein
MPRSTVAMFASSTTPIIRGSIFYLQVLPVSPSAKAAGCEERTMIAICSPRQFELLERFVPERSSLRTFVGFSSREYVHT